LIHAISDALNDGQNEHHSDSHYQTKEQPQINENDILQIKKGQLVDNLPDETSTEQPTGTEDVL
jgi:hypothetical protein